METPVRSRRSSKRSPARNGSSGSRPTSHSPTARSCTGGCRSSCLLGAIGARLARRGVRPRHAVRCAVVARRALGVRSSRTRSRRTVISAGSHRCAATRYASRSSSPTSLMFSGALAGDRELLDLPARHRARGRDGSSRRARRRAARRLRAGRLAGPSARCRSRPNATGARSHAPDDPTGRATRRSRHRHSVRRDDRRRPRGARRPAAGTATRSVARARSRLAPAADVPSASTPVSSTLRPRRGRRAARCD